MAESDLEDEEDYFQPSLGNVMFASAHDGWGFRTQQFADVYATKLGCRAEVLQVGLWSRWTRRLARQPGHFTSYGQLDLLLDLHAQQHKEKAQSAVHYWIIQTPAHGSKPYCQHVLFFHPCKWMGTACDNEPRICALQKALWGNFAFNPKTKRIVALKPDQPNKLKPLFVQARGCTSVYTAS